MQNSSMSFSNPCSFGSWYHTEPSTSEIITAAPARGHEQLTDRDLELPVSP